MSSTDFTDAAPEKLPCHQKDFPTAQRQRTGAQSNLTLDLQTLNLNGSPEPNLYLHATVTCRRAASLAQDARPHQHPSRHAHRPHRIDAPVPPRLRYPLQTMDRDYRRGCAVSDARPAALDSLPVDLYNLEPCREQHLHASHRRLHPLQWRPVP